ncbi:TnsA endonuclease N-terminal domain-containing protein [Paenibacillus roseipurpureus]|uniref:TnsA endonuclease N-terminal domain-containing protein n=1 Tax=Paenibacillus roseopurpureus TaxID=2918901 RepID=A0AA96LNL0_9BACL|nr:TnsA endonuclease N-terminal domain-containing protein [Paenibacillus sp. MBLB1832]WNR43018.1 TnsA endonuclease N-terminal domain-containing protein [Paenibacillus sp. MBLB1832]
MVQLVARRIRPTRGRNYRSKISRSKSLRIIHTESLLERDYVRLANFDNKVLKISFQPIGIRFHYKGRRRRYFPDFLIVTKDGQHFLIEVKLTKYVNSNLNKAKFEAARLLCLEKNWTFHVITEEQIRIGYLQSNLKLLLEVKAHKTTPAVTEFIKTVLICYGPLTIAELLKQCEIVEASMMMLNLHKLIYAHEVKAEVVKERLSQKSYVWVV